jgi:hypothetical protein
MLRMPRQLRWTKRHATRLRATRAPSSSKTVASPRRPRRVAPAVHARRPRLPHAPCLDRACRQQGLWCAAEAADCQDGRGGGEGPTHPGEGQAVRRAREHPPIISHYLPPSPIVSHHLPPNDRYVELKNILARQPNYPSSPYHIIQNARGPRLWSSDTSASEGGSMSAQHTRTRHMHTYGGARAHLSELRTYLGALSCHIASSPPPPRLSSPLPCLRPDPQIRPQLPTRSCR